MENIDLPTGALPTLIYSPQSPGENQSFQGRYLLHRQTMGGYPSQTDYGGMHFISYSYFFISLFLYLLRYLLPSLDNPFYRAPKGSTRPRTIPERYNSGPRRVESNAPKGRRGDQFYPRRGIIHRRGEIREDMAGLGFLATGK